MNTYERYAILDAQIEELTRQKESVKEEIIEDMIKRGKKNEETDLGKFTIAPLKTWTYTSTLTEAESKAKDEIKEIKDEIEAYKAKEQETGDATCVEKLSLRFTGITL